MKLRPTKLADLTVLNSHQSVKPAADDLSIQMTSSSSSVKTANVNKLKELGPKVDVLRCVVFEVRRPSLPWDSLFPPVYKPISRQLTFKHILTDPQDQIPRTKNIPHLELLMFIKVRVHSSRPLFTAHAL